ncbi:AAA family ATPase [Staphylococcus capitis]|uniref:AAA family ATPase n=1 Tax=Staphylococcus capitis TaxID=29388 RepID=UPI003CFF4D39
MATEEARRNPVRRKATPLAANDNQTSAREIQSILSRTVVGQERAVHELSTLLAMHLHWFVSADLRHPTPNALLVGPSGVGKTHAIVTAAQILNVPLVIVDATRLFPYGDQGPSFDSVLIQLISAARRLVRTQLAIGNNDFAEVDELELARRGIIFIDEFDKLADQHDSSSSRNQFLQRRLLQFVDGATISLNPLPGPGEQEIIFETAGLLFVAAGAFTNLDRDAGRRSQVALRSMDSSDPALFEDVVRYGFIPELIARFPVKVQFDSLDASHLEAILCNENVNPAAFYTQYFHSLGVDVEVTRDARQYIAREARKFGVGARGLHQFLFPVFACLSRELEVRDRKTFTLDAEQAARLSRQNRVK